MQITYSTKASLYKIQRIRKQLMWWYVAEARGSHVQVQAGKFTDLTRHCHKIKKEKGLTKGVEMQ